MKYRFKLDTPWGKKGELAPERDTFGWRVREINAEDFPDLFEPVPEEDPKERVAKWLLSFVTGMQYLTLSSFVSEIANKLVDAGLDPEKLK